MTNVLVVDDEEAIRCLIGHLLELNGYRCTLAANTTEAREYIRQKEFELVLSDIKMPGESGLRFLQHVLAEYPDTAAIMVTVNDDPQVAKEAMEIGVYGYVTKPFHLNELLINVANALRRRQLEIDNRLHRENLEKTVLKRTTELRETVERLQTAERELQTGKTALQEILENYRKAIEGIIEAMALAVEMKDPYTGGHQRRVVNLARTIAAEMGLPSQQIDVISMAAVIHDVGKIAIPAEILSKPGPITGLEYSLIKTHAKVSYDILESIEFPWPIAQIVLQHHERMDGSGYPSGLFGGDILLEARILGVADVVEAMSSHRPYRPGLGIDKALEHLASNQSVLYDSDVVSACLKVFAEDKFAFE